MCEPTLTKTSNFQFLSVLVLSARVSRQCHLPYQDHFYRLRLSLSYSRPDISPLAATEKLATRNKNLREKSCQEFSLLHLYCDRLNTSQLFPFNDIFRKMSKRHKLKKKESGLKSLIKHSENRII